jgi:hypothetical protein
MSNERTAAALESQLRERYGLLLTPSQLAELLGQTPAGIRWSLGHPIDERTTALRACARRIGRRLYFPVADVAAIVAGAPR